MNILINIGLVARMLGLTASYVRHHSDVLGLTIHKTSKGHRRYEVEEVKVAAEKVRQQRQCAIDAMLRL